MEMLEQPSTPAPSLTQDHASDIPELLHGSVSKWLRARVSHALISYKYNTVYVEPKAYTQTHRCNDAMS